MSKDLLIDHSEYDLNRVLADQNEIRRHNMQRFEMEQLTAIVHEDRDLGLCVGYVQTSLDDFWVRGHMPGFALMPGVLQCEAAAQLASYFTQRFDLLGSEMVGLGGLEEVRFRGMVRPGDRLVIVVKLTRVRRGAMIVCKFQEFVDQSLVAEGVIKGIPLSSEPRPAQELVAARPGQTS